MGVATHYKYHYEHKITHTQGEKLHTFTSDTDTGREVVKSCMKQYVRQLNEFNTVIAYIP
jgi:hypothetical protein